MKTVIVIPAYNEERTIAEVVRAAAAHGEVIVIDDGSRDATGARARTAGATVYRHAINRGLGAAIGTGFAAARKHGADVVVTMDADGQHDVRDIPALTAPLKDGTRDVVIGVRTADRMSMPLHRKLGNMSGNVATWILFGLWASDSQSGFRAFTIRALRDMHLRGDRMEVSSEIVGEIARCGFRFAEVPIQTIYTEYSLSKGQGFFEGIRTLLRLMVRKILR